ncbi:MAG: superoxide dismutase family protein [Nitrospirota bacterium]|nr:superoxide dismutase family protein [Nitrospirota bacterium]MDH5586025.1 superoxide dismutase family protein [Nitrospirota bacterium]MDH5774219.1 superoxide dismutase family protein [Nitrospirota bacterium]
MLLVTILNGVVAISLAMIFSPNVSEANGPVRASADIYDCVNTDIQLGTAQLKEEKTDEGVKEVSVTMMVKGLTPGKHAVHLHETASCVPCGAAAGHFDPGPHGFSSPDGNHPFHSGDLINIEANPQGNAHLNTTTTRVTLSPGPLSLFDGDGSAFIIHVNPDTYCPDGAVGGCAGGGRAACGIITLE